MHYFKRNIGDYHKKAGRLSMLEHGAYTLLLDACYDRERFPTLDEALEWSWARSDDEIAAVKFVLSKFFSFGDGVYAQQRVQDEINAFHAKSLKNQEIALAREAARRTLRERNEHETCTDHHLPTTHYPIPITQEEIKSSCDQQAGSPEPAAKIPYSEIFDAYAANLPELPQLKLKDDARKRAIKTIWNMDKKFQTADFFVRYFGHVNKSEFLMGRSDNAWKGCCFDWLMKPANFKKIVEGNYHNA